MHTCIDSITSNYIYMIKTKSLSVSYCNIFMKLKTVMFVNNPKLFHFN